jgi:hypothetical protein
MKNPIDIAALEGQTVLLDLPSRGIRAVGHFDHFPGDVPERQLGVRLEPYAAGFGIGKTPMIYILPDSYRYIRDHPDVAVARYILSEA